jgi:hypothetical protein
MDAVVERRPPPASRAMTPVVIGGPLRLSIAVLLAGSSAALTLLGFRLGWGIGWMAWIPAAVLLFPALALAGRRVFSRRDGGLEIADGWLFRRIYSFGIAGGELEILPAGGAWTVVLHLGGRELPLASWVRRATAERLAALLPELPRRVARRPEGDR